jgi:hypothetical protein
MDMVTLVVVLLQHAKHVKLILVYLAICMWRHFYFYIHGYPTTYYNIDCIVPSIKTPDNYDRLLNLVLCRPYSQARKLCSAPTLPPTHGAGFRVSNTSITPEILEELCMGRDGIFG